MTKSLETCAKYIALSLKKCDFTVDYSEDTESDVPCVVFSLKDPDNNPILCQIFHVDEKLLLDISINVTDVRPYDYDGEYQEINLFDPKVAEKTVEYIQGFINFRKDWMKNIINNLPEDDNMAMIRKHLFGE
jgi:hypothetical protein